MRLRPFLAPVALCLALVATGCSSDDSADGPSESSPETSAASSPSASASEPSETSEPDTDTETDTQEVATDQVAFDVPGSWVTVDAAEAFSGDDATEDPVVQDLAERLGVTPEQAVQTFAQMDLIVTSDGERDAGVLTNLNVVHVPGALPTESAARAELKQIGATITSIEAVETGAGDALRVAYTLEAGGGQVRSQALAVDVDGQLVTITVTAGTETTSDELTDLVVDSLTAA
ncbi:hypothetical protein [Nocardioides sp. Leaf374]|uniref:hypothetical protein n=1 Tax=Nocardioides sp. Leaf374 TaxID=2876560 RepID=UPI001E361DC5|nr:hypothetical protein [Nocardioides sp. Leaf374]